MYDKIINDLLTNKAKKATYFITNKEIIRVARTSYHFGFNRGNIELTVTRGKPNYAERELAKGTDPTGMTFYYLPKKKKAPKRK